MSVLDPTQAGGQPPVSLVDIDKIEPDQALMADLRKTRITTPATRVLLILIVLSVSFLAGAFVDREERPSSSTSSSLSSLISQFRGGRGGSGAAGGSGGIASFLGGAGGATTGTVKLVEGSDVYIQNTAGDDIEVTTTPATRVTISQPGTVRQLVVGSTVSVLGTQSTDGTSIAATSIGPSTGRGGFSGFGGAGGLGGGSAATGG